MEVLDDDTVEIRDLDNTKQKQFWIKGDKDDDGYITFKSSGTQNFLTATAPSLTAGSQGLKISGK